MLAAALDQARATVTSAIVEAEADNPAAELLARWLEARLRVTVDRVVTAGPRRHGGPARHRRRRGGHRPSRGSAGHADPAGAARAPAGAQGRATSELIAEELRRLDADEMYAVALRGEATEEIPAHV
ncbi:hypothetical protein GCM10023238_03450 [Streptomyces heliomycini]